MILRATKDAYLGLEAPSPEAWTEWHHAMLEERARAGVRDYDDPTTDWSDRTFRQFFLFMYDASFFASGAYQTAALVERWRARFGRVDSVLLWHAYPRLGFDARGQFDFYRDMPGGLDRLRQDVSDVLHAAGIRVFVDYNPWAEPSGEAGYAELGEIVATLDADGVMLDTMTSAPEALARSVRARRPGVVFAPELRPCDEDLAVYRQAWAQWADVGDGPSVPRHRWLVPRHRQLTIRRWDRSRRGDIVYSFFNGSGLLLWDNVFGAWNPYDRADRRLIAETAAVLDRYEELFVHGTWEPLIPTGVPGLDANRWTLGGRSITTLRNRTGRSLAWSGDGQAFWGDRTRQTDRGRVTVEPFGVQAVVVDPDAADALAHFDALSRRADVELPDDDERTPRPRLVTAPRVVATAIPPDFAPLPGGDFTMKIRHRRRECGCYPLGATDAAMWGWNYEDVIEHEIPVSLPPYAIRRGPVTNAEFRAFVRATGHAWPDRGGKDAAPVTYVSLSDARAFAAWRGERLPSEAEWQLAADTLGLAAGGPWELTESEHTDGHTRFVMLRGGAPLPPGESEWLPERGPRPNDSHVKYLLLDDALDRSETISFRTVVSAS
ncbi:MAG: SUMF1/EgtB/PvdO family nonheme iron enzyme [Labilithrix sp.]